jgi:hypothetical protein
VALGFMMISSSQSGQNALAMVRNPPFHLIYDPPQLAGSKTVYLACVQKAGKNNTKDVPKGIATCELCDAFSVICPTENRS